MPSTPPIAVAEPQALAGHEQRPWKLCNSAVRKFVNSTVVLTVPDRIYWCNGSDYEHRRLEEQLISQREHDQLRAKQMPGARYSIGLPVEMEAAHLCCGNPGGSCGPATRSVESAFARTEMRSLFKGCMRGRTLYIAPITLEITGQPCSAILLTDSLELVLRRRQGCEVGNGPLRRLCNSQDFIRCLHCTGDQQVTGSGLTCHFSDREVWAFGQTPPAEAANCPQCVSLGLTCL